jgi:hypothetical protein
MGHRTISNLATAAYMLAIAGRGLAQSTTTITLPFYGYDQQSIDASILGVTRGATTMALACDTHISDYANNCGLFPYQTLTYGPSTYNMYMSDDGFTGTQDCKQAVATASTDGQLATATAGVCAEWNTGSSANFPGSSTTTYDVTNLAVTVTAGAQLLKGSGGASASASATAGSSTSTGSGASSGSSAASTRTASGSGSRTTTASGSTSATASGNSTTATNDAAQGVVMATSFSAVGVVIGLLGLFL